jgi:hypothetical protein
MHACNTYLSRYRLIEAVRSSTRAGLPMQNFSDFELSSTEPKSLRFIVLEKDALLMTQQQIAPAEHSQAFGRPTQESIILELVIPQFVGAIEYCFLAGVSRGWRAQQLRLSFAEAVKKGRTTDKLRTCHRTALKSAARLQLAIDSGLTFVVFQALTALQLVNLVQSVAVDVSAQAGVLALAREHGNRWSENICAEAARAGDLRALMWAREQNYCTWWLGQLLNSAAKGGHLNVLQWLHSNSERRWTRAEQARMLFAAGQCSDSAAAKWLRANGAAWPQSFYTGKTMWPVATVQWALANGCG